ncbi:EAL domain-containing protein [Oceanidesulfovibrio marinus]|uniref:EAL domain-containing protein n=1 Tax=Oceanidesulfovibrio marinus TaxID=370038 RepID=A0A6P1ZLF3_9BACT|nr:EAL domain-containing protein [Oceanidesulfovibrio marinus]QJT08958.1 EAL domain-containing protein [Oceanidesulfovibrio marinus]TVM36623.1 sensor domain-containing diguanylate cyclase [Oceanidesulfovibrio marinus]
MEDRLAPSVPAAARFRRAVRRAALALPGLWAVVPAGQAYAAAPTFASLPMLAPVFGLILIVVVVALVVALNQVLSARRAIAERLRELQSQLAILSVNAADIIVLTDPMLRPRFVSDSVRKVLGYGSAQFGSLPVERRFPAGFENHLREHGNKRETIRHTGPLDAKDGRRLWMEALSTPSFDDAGSLTGYVHVIRDVTASKESEARLREQEIRFRKLISDQADALLVVGPGGDVRFANPAAAKMFCAEVTELTGMRFGMIRREESPLEMCILYDGGYSLAEMRVSDILWDGEGCAAVYLHDTSSRLGIEKALRESEERYRMVAEYTHDWELWIGPDGEVLFTSPSCERVSGYPPDEFRKNPALLDELVLENDRETWSTLLREGPVDSSEAVDFRFVRRGGDLRWVCVSSQRVYDEDGVFQGTRSSLRDITNRKNMEMELRHKSLHDVLTGLANRDLCLDRIQRGLQRAKRRASFFFAVLFIDLDRFKIINESLGHNYGDKLLKQVAERLTHHVRGMDTVSRFGSDEFVLFLDDLDSPREAIAAAKRINASIRLPYRFDNHEVLTTASMGIVLGPVFDITAEDMLRNATIALHRAKELGGDRFKVFTERMLDQAMQRMSLERDLRQGLANDEFFLVYQPVLRMKDRQLVGFEALVRWQHPSRGLLLPGEFIPLAEETGQILELGRFVLQEACSTMAAWQEQHPETEPFFLSVNLSGRQFSSLDLIEQVRSIIYKTGISASRIKLEITETTIMEDAENAVEKLRRLKNLGLTISIDDFGTGYSSMSYLQQFPLDNLKIDLSFVRLMEVSPENKEIVRAIVSLAHTLGLDVVAEGVENEQQEQTLRDLGCEYAQGFLYARPMPADDARRRMLETA